MADRTWWGLNTAVSQRHPPVFPWLLLPHLPYLLPHPIFPFHYNAFPTLPSRNPFPDARRFSHLWFVFVTDGVACAAQAEATLVRDFQQVQQGEAGEAGSTEGGAGARFASPSRAHCLYLYLEQVAHHPLDVEALRQVPK